MIAEMLPRREHPLRVAMIDMQISIHEWNMCPACYSEFDYGLHEERDIKNVYLIFLTVYIVYEYVCQWV